MPSVHTRWPLATPAQVRYLEILFNDLGYSSTQRRAKIEADFHVKHSDELTISDASRLIDELKKAKEDL